MKKEKRNMKYYLVIVVLFLMSGVVAEASNKKEVEICNQVSEIDEAYVCDFGSLYMIHFKGQAPVMISKAPPTPTPVKEKKK